MLKLSKNLIYISNSLTSRGDSHTAKAVPLGDQDIPSRLSVSTSKCFMLHKFKQAN